MSDIEIRAGGLTASGKTLTGRIAYNSEAAMPGFHEVIRPGAFTRSLSDGRNIRALYHHQAAEILGTTKAGTLQLREDDHGLEFSLVLPETSYGRDLGILVERGDVTGASFGFRVPSGGDLWLERDGGDWLRELRDVELFEVTVTPDPAYQDTSVALRSKPSVYEHSWYRKWMETCR